MGKHLVLVGAGHAHLTTVKNIKNITKSGHRVTVISKNSYQYYSGMGPGLLGGTYTPQEVRFNVKSMTQEGGGEFIEDAVVSINPSKYILNLKNHSSINYDVVSFNTGSEVDTKDFSGIGKTVFPAKPVENLFLLRNLIKEKMNTRPLRIIVVGGGAAGVELVSNIMKVVRGNTQKSRITLLSGGDILSRHGKPVREKAIAKMKINDIEIIGNCYMKKCSENSMVLSDGSIFDFDFALIATGINASSLFYESGLSDDPGKGLMVNRFLQSTEYENIFGGGDCIHFKDRPLDKVGVYAVRQNKVLLHNIINFINNKPLEEFKPQEHYLLILNMGDGTGIFFKGRWMFNGKTGFRLKDHIDRKFMKEFQISGELSERI